MRNKTWYRSLKKSRLTPPDYVFSIVWPILYTLLGISFYFMLSSKECVGLCRPLVFFLAQMGLNIVWTTLFFRYKMIRVGLVALLAILGLTVVTFITLLPVSKWAAYLLIPYMLWLSLASYLNLYIVLHN